MHESHPLAKQKSIIFNDLKQVNYVDRLRCEFRDTFLDELKSREINLQLVVRSEREDLISESISNSIGVTTMPRSAAEHAGLTNRTFDDMLLTQNISIVTVKNRELHPAVIQFMVRALSAYTGT